jgi:dienelactone hydrolase
MNGIKSWFYGSLILILVGCNGGVATPEAIGIASPQAVELSLSTVDPEQNIHLFDYDKNESVDIQEQNRWHEDNATWIDFTYASPKGGQVQARKIIPDGDGPFPGIILQHGGTGRLEDMTPQARQFVRYGAVVMMITDPYRRPGGWEITEYMGNIWPIFTKRDLEIKIQLIVDLRRAIDILSALPQVDSGRMAYYGVSFGGAMGGLLAGIEDRLQAYVLVVGDGGLVEHTSDPGEDGLPIHFSENWAALMWPTESLHFIGRAAPANLLFQNGIYDTFVPPHDAIRYQTAASEPKTIYWYSAGHGLPWQHVIDAARWLQTYLGKPLFLLAPNYHSSAVVYDRLLLTVILLTVGVFIWDMFRFKSFDWGNRFLWLLVVILLGPVGLVLYWFAIRKSMKSPDQTPVTSKWNQAFVIAILYTTTLAASLFVGDKLNDLIPTLDFRIRLVQLYITTVLIARLLSLLSKRTYRVSFSAHILVMNIYWVVDMLAPPIFRKFFDLTTWMLYPLETMIGIALTLPLHFWLLKNKLESWHLLHDSGVSELQSSLIRWFLIAGLLVISYCLVLGSVLVMLKLVTGLDWTAVILILRGINLHY